MYSRSRKKIILSIMISLVLLFVLTLTAALFTSYREIQEKNREMLERYEDLYSLEQQPGSQEKPEGGPLPDDVPSDVPPDFQLSTFYSVALAEDGTVLAVDDGKKGVYSREELIGIASELIAGNKETGRNGGLTYSISWREGYILAAFMDTTLTESSLRTLRKNVLLVGGAAIVLLFFIAVYLSKQIIRPLEENDRQQKQFLSDASHELKTPVSVIGANAELLSREIGRNEWLANIQYENERMGELLKQLLELSRAENREVVESLIDFSRLVTGETLAFESLAFDRGKKIAGDIEEGIFLLGNQTQFEQLVSVLLDNAIQHSTGGEIRISLKKQMHAAVLKVINEGEEIPPEKQGHLFERFYRVDEARNSEEQHYGLGLAIAKAITEKHGGSIGVSCHDGIVEFSVSIPIKK